MLGWRSAAAALETEVSISAVIITEVINNDPELWRFEGHRLTYLLRKRLDVKEPEARRIVDTVGNVIEQNEDRVPWPQISRGATLYESGRPVAQVVIDRSLRPVLAGTALVALFGLVLAWVIHAFLVMLLKELQNALGALLEEKERGEVTLHAIGEGVISTDADGRVLLMNPVAERLTGWSLPEAAGRPIGEVFEAVDARTGDPFPDPLNVFRKHRDTESVSRYALQTSRRGRIRRIADSAAPIRGEQGALQGMVVVFRDVTEQHRLEEELLKTQKLESVGVLAAGIAHDFNNILTAILGNISLAAEQVGPREPVQGRLFEASKACQRARDLTSQLLTFSRGGAPIRKTGEIAALIRETAGFALAGAKSRCRFDFAADLWPVDIDDGQISQVVHNLVVNAEQAMPSGGTIAIRGGNVVIAAGDGLPVPPGRYVRVSIEDQGEGILPEHIASIFDPYFTTKREGSGLGLAVCFNVIRQHGGHLGVRSTPGCGATFTFHLPASGAAAEEAASREGAPAHGAGRVLVMDDDPEILDVAGAMLAHLEYEPAFARDGAEALERYREAKTGGRPFSAVIMDLTIPGGMGGREAVRRLLELDPGARVIVSSGYSNDPVMADFRAYGFLGVIAKPYLMGTFSSVLTEVLAAPPAGGPA
jgi:PAS domain S-box-containing protein